MTRKQRELYDTIDQAGTLSGLEIYRKTARYLGFTIPTMYLALEEMEAANWVRHQEEPGGPERGGHKRFIYFIARRPEA